MAAKKLERSAADFLPLKRTLSALRVAAQSCEGCDLYKRATQTVFGEGPAKARVVLIGEQPGDQEDKVGRPFVGPAGAMLDKALEAAGIPRGDVYVTNAVKHFKWKNKDDQPLKKRRIHDKPKAGEIRACRPWLDAELEALRPALIICLGASAISAVLGSKIKVTKDRGKVLELEGLPPALVSMHPSAILRMSTSEDRKEGFDALVRDLKIAAKYVKKAA